MVKSGIHFNLSERKILLRLFDVLFSLFALYLLSNTIYFDYFKITKEHWYWVVVFVFYLSIFGTIFELYDLQKSSRIEKIAPGIVLTCFVTVLFYLFTPYFTPILPDNRQQIFLFYFAVLSGLFLWRLIYSVFIVAPRFYKKVLIIGETSNIEKIIETFKIADPNYHIIGFVDSEAHNIRPIKFKAIPEYTPKEIKHILKKENISEILVTSYNVENIKPEVYEILVKLLNDGFPINDYIKIYEELTRRFPIQFVGQDFYRYFPFSKSGQNRLYLFFHRFFDVLFSLIGLVFTITLIPIIFIGNLFANQGSLFYLQDRVGENGEIFKIIKFRTMIMNAEKSGAVWAKNGDKRITPFGKFLRHSRLDETPQFINILKGDMSLIGPRPERPFFVKELSQVLPFYKTRHIIKPGLTGWAQVKTRYGASVNDSLRKLQYDLYYIKYRSFFLDINILIKTTSTVIFYRGQ